MGRCQGSIRDRDQENCRDNGRGCDVVRSQDRDRDRVRDKNWDMYRGRNRDSFGKAVEAEVRM